MIHADPAPILPDTGLIHADLGLMRVDLTLILPTPT